MVPYLSGQPAAHAPQGDVQGTPPQLVPNVQYGDNRLSILFYPCADLVEFSLLLALRVEAQHDEVGDFHGLSRTTFENFATFRSPPSIGSGRVDELASTPCDVPHLSRKVALGRGNRGTISVYHGLNEGALSGTRPPKHCDIYCSQNLSLALKQDCRLSPRRLKLALVRRNDLCGALVLTGTLSRSLHDRPERFERFIDLSLKAFNKQKALADRLLYG